MKIVYVAGPYRSKYGFIGRLINIIRARKVAKALWAMGYAVICPHSNSAFFDGIVEDEQFLNGCLEILKRCDLIVFLKGWQKSHGTHKERATVRLHNKPGYYWENPDDRKQLKELIKT